jgi:Arc/MetJ family transcription regulator
MPVSVTSSDDELIAEVRAWLQLLAERKYVDALRRIPGEQGEAWTPQLLEEVIAGYGLPQSPPETRGMWSHL